MSAVAYVVKRYPRFSETFIVNELLAHEQAGLGVEIYSLRPPVDSHFQDLISGVRAPLTYLSNGGVKASELWTVIQLAQKHAPQLLKNLGSVTDEDSLDIYCGLKLALACLQSGIIHMHAHFASSAASVARIASRLSGIPYSVTAHAKDIFHESVTLKDLERKISDSTVTFTVSDYNLEHLQRELPQQAAYKVVRLYNGIHLEQFPYQSPQHRRPRIVAVGRLVEKKGFSFLVEACALMRSQQLTFSCCIVGDGELLPELQAQIRELDIGSHVQLLGPQPQKIVKELIAESAVLAAPCINGADGNRDGLPTVLLEAMALGTPCVSTDVTGIPEVIVNGRTGLLVGQQDSVALAKSLARLLQDGDARSSLSIAARDLLVREFDIKQNSAQQRQYFGCNHSRMKQRDPQAPMFAEV